MALIYNASSKDQKVKVFGNWFEIPSGKIKVVQDNIARFMAIDRQDRGFVALSEAFEDPEYKLTPDGQAELAEAKRQGVANRIKALQAVINNETVSLQQDLTMKNINVDSRGYMDDKAVEHLKELTEYRNSKSDEDAAKLQKIKDLEKELG